MGLLRLLCKIQIVIASGYLIGRTLLPENQWLLFLSNIQAYLLLPSVISALILLGRKTGLYFPLALFAFAHAPFSLLSAPEYCLSGKVNSFFEPTRRIWPVPLTEVAILPALLPSLSWMSWSFKRPHRYS